MRRSSIVVVALASLLTASSLLVPALAGASSVTPAATAGPAAPTLAITTTDSSGGLMTQFESGLASGRVYFEVTDSSADKNVTVQINDRNASRDGITDPAASWTVPIQGGENLSWEWGIFYQIPVNLVDSGTWNITVHGTSGGFAFWNFTVRTYGIEVGAIERDALPAQNMSYFWSASATANAAPFTALSSAILTATYTTSSSTTAVLPNTPATLDASAGFGWFNFSVPTNALGLLSLTIWGNQTTGGKFSDASTASGDIGTLGLPAVTLSSCPNAGCVTSDFTSGAPVYVGVTEGLEGISGPAVGVSATFKFESGATFVNPPGNPPSSVVTDASGNAAITFLASASVFSSRTLNTVSVTVSDPADPGLTTRTTNATFTISNGTTYPRVTVAFSSSEYFSGGTGSGAWTLGGGNSSVVAGWSIDYWEVVGDTGSGFLLVHTVAGTSASSGSFTFTVPTNYLGEIVGVVVASNATAETEAVAVADATPGEIELAPSELTYAPGDTISIGVATQGAALAGATLWATITNDLGGSVYNAAVSGGSLSISVPSTAPPTSYTVTVIAQTASGGTLASASQTLTLALGVDLKLGITTSSNYLDGSYQPGETVTVSYTFVASPTVPLPPTYTVTLLPAYSNATGSGQEVVVLSSASGTFSYRIPSGAPNGLLYVTASAQLGGSGCLEYCSAAGYFTAEVNGNPSSLSYNFGNSGFSLGALVFVIILLALLVIGLIVWRRRGGKTMVMHPEPASGSAAASSGAPSGTGSGSSMPPTGTN